MKPPLILLLLALLVAVPVACALRVVHDRLPVLRVVAAP